MFSEDDGWESRALSRDDDEDWEPASRPYAEIANHNHDHIFGNGQEKGTFHITPEHIALVRLVFPLPPELITQILDLAEYWAYSQTICLDQGRFHNANVRYLRSNPIQGGEFTHPLRRVVVTTDSKDQGWSSYPDTHGTHEGSWTWFELTLDDGGTGGEMVRVEVVRNVHAGFEFERYRTVIEDGRILRLAKKGDQLSVWVRANYPGWCNHVRSVQIEVWSAC